MTPRSREQIEGELIGYLVATTPLKNWRPGSVIAQIVGAIADEIATLETAIMRMRDSQYVATAPERDLEALAIEYTGAGRRGPSKATGGGVQFTRDDPNAGDLFIPSGTVVARGDGFEYETLADVTIAQGETTSQPVDVVARIAGVEGNCDAGAIIKVVDGPQGITSVTNTTAVSGGEDIESLAALRQRVQQARIGRQAATVQGIMNRVFEVEDDTYGRVAYAVFSERASAEPTIYISDQAGGLDVRATAPAGEVLIEAATSGETVLYLKNWPVVSKHEVPYLIARSPDGTQTQTIKCHLIAPWGAVYLDEAAPLGWSIETALDYEYYVGLVAVVQKAIDGRDVDQLPVVPPGVIVTVRPATRTLVSLSAHLVFSTGTAPDTTLEDIKRTLPEQLNDRGIGEPLRIAEVVAALMGYPHVENVKDVRLQGNQKDKSAMENEILRVDGANVSLSYEVQK